MVDPRSSGLRFLRNIRYISQPIDQGCAEFTGSNPIFQQLADQIADEILSGSYPEETAVPSATDFAVFHQMNPATASKGVNMLVDLGVLYKKRGIGMFVAPGARDVLREQRRETFRVRYLQPLLREASVLDIQPEELHSMIDDEGRELA